MPSALGLTGYLAVSAVLIMIGLYCVLAKRNAIRIIIGLQIMAAGVNLSFISLSFFRVPGFIDPFPHTIVITFLVLEALLTAIAIGFIFQIYKHYGTLDIRKLRRLRW